MKFIRLKKALIYLGVLGITGLLSCSCEPEPIFSTELPEITEWLERVTGALPCDQRFQVLRKKKGSFKVRVFFISNKTRSIVLNKS